MINEDAIILNKKHLSKLRVLVVGDYRLDYNYIGCYSGLSRENEALAVFDAERVTRNPGGGANLATNLAEAGISVAAFGIVGDDEDGDVLVAQLKSHNVETSLLQHEGQTGVFIKQYFPSGVHVGRSNIRASKPTTGTITNLRRFLDVIRNSSTFHAIVVADYDESGCGIVDSILSDIPHSGITFGMSRNDVAKFTGYNYVICNRKELLEHIGGTDFDRGLARIRTIAGTAVITLEGKGAMVVDEQDSCTVPSQPLDGTIDSCGAGDSFTAAFIVAKLCSYANDVATQWANAAARWTCKQLYGVGGYPTPSDIFAEYQLLYHQSIVELNLEHLQPVKIDPDHIWGREHWLANCEPGGYGAKILEFRTGYKGSEHAHITKDEILIASNVPIRVYTRADENATLVRNEILKGGQLRIVPGQRHMIVNKSGQTAYIFEVSNFEDEQTTKYSSAGVAEGDL